MAGRLLGDVEFHELRDMLTGVTLPVGDVGGDEIGETRGPGNGVNGLGYDGDFSSGDFVKPGDEG